MDKDLDFELKVLETRIVECVSNLMPGLANGDAPLAGLNELQHMMDQRSALLREREFRDELKLLREIARLARNAYESNYIGGELGKALEGYDRMNEVPF